MSTQALDSTLQVGGVNLHYQTVGRGEDVVLIHGLGANLAFWFLGVARVLANDYRVITYDLRGHGRSSMPARGYRLDDMTADLDALLNHLGVDRCHVVGHSFGARIGLLYSISRPSMVKSLTVADTQLSALQPRLRLREWAYWSEWRRQLQDLGIEPPDDNEYLTFKLLAWMNQHSLDATLGGLARRINRRPSLKSRNMGKKGTLLWQKLLETTTAGSEFEEDDLIQVQGLRRIQAPTLAVYGEHSHCMPTALKLRQIVPGCELRIVPKAGHFHPATRPKIFMHMLESFLRSHSSF